MMRALFHRRSRVLRQGGLTLTELLVSLVLASIITLAATALYSVTVSSYKTVDAAQELQDSGRFALEVIGQAARMAGYQNYAQRDGSGNDNSRRFAATTFPTVRGFNNSTIKSSTLNDGDGATDNGGLNRSDTLAFRFHGSSKRNNAVEADGSIIDCLGTAKSYPANPDDVGLSLFSVAVDTSGEPALRCTSSTSTTPQPIVKGVETFQVMYGLDADDPAKRMGTPIKWVSGQNITTTTDWVKVVAVRVGLVIRGDVGSSQGASAKVAENDFYPLGKEFTGTSTEAGLKFTAPNDGRLRRVFNATFKLRNSQD